MAVAVGVSDMWQVTGDRQISIILQLICYFIGNFEQEHEKYEGRLKSLSWFLPRIDFRSYSGYISTVKFIASPQVEIDDYCIFCRLPLYDNPDLLMPWCLPRAQPCSHWPWSLPALISLALISPCSHWPWSLPALVSSPTGSYLHLIISPAAGRADREIQGRHSQSQVSTQVALEKDTKISQICHHTIFFYFFFITYMYIFIYIHEQPKLTLVESKGPIGTQPLQFS